MRGMPFYRCCNQSIDLYLYDSAIKCNGPCQGEFHSPCTNLGNQKLQILKTVKNIVWKCENCFCLCYEGFINKKCEISDQILYKMKKRIQVLEHKLFIYTLKGDLNV